LAAGDSRRVVSMPMGPKGFFDTDEHR
jgi:hypothetical protein